jgi:long-chain fatty acid transport protein
VALGVGYDFSAQWRLRAGYNYGRNPVPERNLNPTLAAISEHHLTLGAGYAFSEHWRTDGALEYLVGNEVTYSNPDLPFGPNAAEKSEMLAVQLTLSRIW